ncbi:MAG TPA: transcriptional regulator [Candidatus Hydrogenedentes bacterium]|nr:transcriptional regulator [Candidatus Hydrogenedentota bacterium]HPU98046.1 transcriptional regulator [Candidatus Hydrogenedentota bacterium]
MKDLDRVIHEPARLRILTLLAGLEAADFMFLLTTTGLTKGNLSSHMDKLEKAGYVSVRKTFVGRVPHTEYTITPEGAAALDRHWRELDEIRNLRPGGEGNASGAS